MVATFGPAKYLVETDDTIGPRTPMHRPNVGMKSASRNVAGMKVSANRMLIPAAVPTKVAVTVCRYPKRSESKPLPITLRVDEEGDQLHDHGEHCGGGAEEHLAKTPVKR